MESVPNYPPDHHQDISRSTVADLSPHAREILKLTEDYIRTNRTVEVEKLVDYLSVILAKRDNPLNRNGIKKYLNQLLTDKWILSGSKLTRANILSHPKRREIFDAIQENICLYPYQIHKILNIPHQIILWHLDVLERFEFVRIWEIDSHQVYYPTQTPLKKVYLHYFSQNSKASAILDYLKANIGEVSCTQTHLVSELGMHPQTVRKYLKYLTKYRLISKRKKERKTVYEFESNI